MKKSLVILIALLICASSSLAYSTYYPQETMHVSHAYLMDEYVRPNDEVVAVVNLENLHETNDFEWTAITMYIPELSVRRKMGRFTLDDGDEVTRSIMVVLPADTPKGEYAVRLTISDTYGNRRVIHRFAFVN